ncbi:TIGR00266 family protein [Ketobacter sp. MCCC 1A13808]|uniref:TIGR00266 family protein n=1 Tax=Ketobacter sp. MCCC 1A13808 TaxID=2602738 RepID=UPI000F13DEA5|nr:TIGR00266 family protein [Ketobacter sp. MCCC 1A13808]MVF11714.1 TIGR00266 family protein [Ketobacter sp. MCCC 1A13808]RLP55325.1 MAG: TIGR00266 family protein [Ketobacter sp.]
MKIELINRPGNTAAKVTLQNGEICTAESGAMIAMSGNMNITTTTHKKGSGGLMKAIKRMVAGESLFLNHFETQQGDGEIWFGTSLAGDMEVMELDQENLIVQGSSFLACEHGVDIDLGWQGFKSVFSGERVFWLNLKGSGKVVVSSFGAIYPVQVDGDYIVDTGHIVAFNESLDFSITKAGSSWFHSFLGGEGLVCRFHGKGTVWCQSHNPISFGQAMSSGLRPRRA